MLSYYHLFALALVVVRVLVLVAVFGRGETNLPTAYHGPNQNAQFATTSTESELEQSSIPNVLATLVVSVDQNVEQTPVVSIIDTEQYGIAAGGGLIFLEQKELNQYFDALRALGVQWVRWDIDWSVIQPDNATSYQWEGADRVATTAKRYGINSLGIITYAPPWALAWPCDKELHCAPANPKTFGRFAGEVALRYKDSIGYWEIWNEPNYVSFWAPKPDANSYAALLKETYVEIKRANPQAVVLSGGLAATGNEGDGSLSSATFINGLYTLGANQYFDAVALHPYTYPVLPSYQAWWNRWQQIMSIHQLMIDKGDAAKKIWITEFGAPTGGPGQAYTANQLDSFAYRADFMSEKAQLDIMTEATDFYRQYSDWMGPFFWYSLHNDSLSQDTPENFFGLIRYDGSKKPAYNTFRDVISSRGVQ